MIDEQSTASGHDYASDRSAIWAGCDISGVKSVSHAIYSDIYYIWEPITIIIYIESLQTFAYILPVGQCTPEVKYVSDVIPRQ